MRFRRVLGLVIFMRMGKWLYDRIWANSASSVCRGFVGFVGLFGIESAGLFSATLISVVCICAFCATSTSSFCVDFFAFLLNFAFVSFACLVLVIFLSFWGVSSLATSLGFGVVLGVEISCVVFSVWVVSCVKATLCIVA